MPKALNFRSVIAAVFAKRFIESTLTINITAWFGLLAFVAARSIKSSESAVKLLAGNNNDCAPSLTPECWCMSLPRWTKIFNH